jgi:hypothetical protein
MEELCEPVTKPSPIGGTSGVKKLWASTKVFPGATAGKDRN